MSIIVYRKLSTSLAQLRGARVGAESYVSRHALLRDCKNIVIGRRTAVGRGAELNAQGGSITVGDDCTIHNFAVLYGAGGIVIGDDCRISNGVVIVSFNHEFNDPTKLIRNHGISKVGILVKSDVWIGARAVVLDGVTVGAGSVIGAASVVTRDVPDRTVVAGNPARVIRDR